MPVVLELRNSKRITACPKAVHAALVRMGRASQEESPDLLDKVFGFQPKPRPTDLKVPAHLAHRAGLTYRKN